MKKNNNIILNGLIDLAQPRLGTKVVYRTDDFFAAAKRIIDPSPPIFKEGVFDKNGKWMDGWETRRKRKSGHDYLILKLGKPGRIHKVDIDTSHFNGNQPSMISIEGAYSNSNKLNQLKWISIISKKKTKANSHHFFSVKNKKVFTHIKFNIFPDGGVARLRLYGSIAKTKKLLQLKVDVGIDIRTIVSGIAESFSPNEIVGQQVTVLTNLAPRKIKGVESQGMILMTDTIDGKLTFVEPEQKVSNGQQIS